MQQTQQKRLQQIGADRAGADVQHRAHSGRATAGGRRFGRAAVRAQPVQDQVVVENRDPGLALERGKIAGPDQARHRHELAAIRAVQMVVVRAAQFEPGASVIEQQLANDAAGGQLLGGSEYRGEIARMTALDESRMQLVERPGMPFAAGHQADHRGGDSGFAGHAEL